MKAQEQFAAAINYPFGDRFPIVQIQGPELFKDVLEKLGTWSKVMHDFGSSLEGNGREGKGHYVYLAQYETESFELPTVLMIGMGYYWAKEFPTAAGLVDAALVLMFFRDSDREEALRLAKRMGDEMGALLAENGLTKTHKG